MRRWGSGSDNWFNPSTAHHSLCSSETMFQTRARPHGPDMGYAFRALATHTNGCFQADHPNEHLVSVGGRNVPAHRREDKA
jgi:hypothetical protein